VMLGMKEPFTPLGFEIMGFMFPTIINTMTVQKRPLGTDFVKHAAGRIFVDMTYLMANGFVARQFAGAFSGNDLPMAGAMRNLLDQHGKTFRRQGIRFKIPWGFLRYGFGVMGKFMAARKVAPEDRYAAVIAIADEVHATLAHKAQSLQTVEEKLAFSRQALVSAFQMSQDQAWYCTEFTNLPKIQAKITKKYGDRFDTSLLDQVFPGCISVEMGVRLNQLAQHFDTTGEEPSADHPKILEFLAQFGHRSAIELDFGVARWSEDPAYVFNLVRSYMVDQMYARNLAEIEETKAKIDQLLTDLYAATKADSGERAAVKQRDQIMEARRAAGMREYPKFAIVRMLALAREVMLGVGREFQAADRIDQPEDIFFLYSDEILQGQDLRRRVARNRDAYRKEMARTSIPRIVLNSGETYYSAHTVDPNSNVLQGMPLSPGIYEGEVRVVFDPASSELREGEVMVTESTNPAWTPLFMTAKGLIMEYGGPVSHGGIVAREYGIPAVVGISSATSVLHDGQRVRVNGESGVVEILE
ncbi:MAG: hypothetical protein KDD84_22650, partial [Caldilineaceae bacterium]|nr:hypothetical protein [Caldilineaceae bacterium]